MRYKTKLSKRYRATSISSRKGGRIWQVALSQIVTVTLAQGETFEVTASVAGWPPATLRHPN